MKYAIERRPLFPLGRLVATPGALAALRKAGQSPAEFLSLHVRGQLHGFRLLSGYRTKANETIWVLTESDRSVTTLLLPSETELTFWRTTTLVPFLQINFLCGRWGCLPPVRQAISIRYGGRGGGDRKYELLNKACVPCALQLTPLANRNKRNKA